MEASRTAYITSGRRATATICPGPCMPRTAAQLQPIHALRLACGAQRTLLPVAVGSMNIRDVRDRRRQKDVRQTSDVQRIGYLHIHSALF